MFKHLSVVALAATFAGAGGAAAQEAVKPPLDPKPHIDAPPKPEPIPSGGWEISESASALTGAASYAALLDSSNAVANSIGIAERAALVVRCAGGQVAVYVAWPFYLGNRDVLIGYRFDQERAVYRFWNVSSDGKSSGFFRGRGAEGLLQSVGRAQSLVVQAEAYGGGAREAIFDLSQSADVVAEVSRRCGR